MAHNEQVFTPDYIVNSILNKVGYIKSINPFTCISKIMQKHIIDNSCGNGAFLIEIVGRYIDECKYYGLENDRIINELETYIHGIEIDNSLVEETINKLTILCKIKGLDLTNGITFDIQCKDTLTCTDYDGKMDYVVGNPPYCKVHDLKEKYNVVKEYRFAQGGMTDLYLVFFEIGIYMLNKTGKLGYITPNSWMTSKAGLNFRKWIKSTNKLSEIVQFGSMLIFNEATTFTNITILDNTKLDNEFKYSYGIDDKFYIGNLDNSFINYCFYLGNDETLNNLSKIINFTTYNKLKIKNGFATLKDKLFIFKTKWKENIFEENLIEMYKASTGKIVTAIYPYDKEGKPVKYEDLNKKVQEILETQAKIFDVDTSKEDWYLYGRYQGIKDMSKHRIAINNLINDDVPSIKLKYLEPYVGIYSGLYMVCENDETFIQKNYEKISEIIKSDDFINYIKSLGKYKNGGYYTFSSKDLERFVNYKLFNKN